MSQVEQYVISLDKYQIIRQIGEGAYAIVFLVEDKETKKQYAAKVGKFQDEDSRQRCLRSIEFMGSHHNQALANFVGYSPVDFEGNESLTIITDFESKGNLEDLIHKRELDDTQRQIILVGICRAMNFIHQQNYIHRDLKPDNVVIDEHFHPHLTGFMLLDKYELGKKFEQACGTIIFMAPEVINESEYDLKADVYSFAILMYQVVTGTCANKIYPDIHSPFQLYKLVAEGRRPEFKAPIKKSIQTLIEQCWSLKPSDRLTFEQLFQKLAYDPEYYLDGADANKVKAYADSLK